MTTFIDREVPRKQKTSTKIYNALSGLVDKGNAYYKEQTEKAEDTKALKALGVPDEAIALARRNPKVMEQLIGGSVSRGNEAAKQQTTNQNNEEVLRGIEEERQLPEGSLNKFRSNPSLANQVTKPVKKTQASQSIEPEQLKIIENIRKTPEYAQADELGKYQLMTSAGVSRENAKDEANISGEKIKRSDASFEKAYKYNEPFINETTSKFQSFESETKPRLMYLAKEAKNEDLIGPTAAAFLEAMGIPLGALENPNSEAFQKISQDLLKGLPESYGSRILKVEVDNFLKTIPTLMNSPEGRRMIASNMLKLGEMKEVFYNEMRKQQKDAIESNKMPIDFQQNVFDAVRPQIDRVNREFLKMSEVTSIPPNTVPFFNPNGEISFVPKDKEQWAIDNGGKRIW